jgi:hypothetical protein
MFDFDDLSSETQAGTRDETVSVTIRRGYRLIETWIALGPMGVALQADGESQNW